LGGGVYRCVATATAAGPIKPLFYFHNGLTPGLSGWQYIGDNTSTIEITRIQVEESATATAYQKVVSGFDIIEAGVESVYYAGDDGDDALTVAMPDLGTDATRAVFNLDGTVTYLESQTIGAGNVDIPLDCKGVLYIDRDLTADEKADLEAWNA
jgi:hypothetical protein